MMKTYVLLFAFLGIQTLTAQVGINTISPDVNSILDIYSTTKGMVIPRVGLSATNSAAPMSAHVVGMVVYNTGTSGVAPNNVTPGMYYNTGAKWERLAVPSEVPKTRGIERVNTSNATTFTKVGTDFIWTAGGAAGAPLFSTTPNVWAPYGSSTSFITVVPGVTGTDPDSFRSSKNIVSLRFYTEIQISTVSNVRWRTNLFLNGVAAGTGNYWGAPPNNCN
jgi:hypothetical protein